MQFPEIRPYLFKIGTLEVRWYGLMYILGFLAVYLTALSGAKRKKLPLSKDDIADLVFALAVGLIVGARFGYALFYNVSYYLANPLKVFAVWEGGMSFHGGLIGTVLAALYFSRKKKIGMLQIADLITPAAPIGLGLGRLGNFINGELYGRVTDVPWGVVFPTGGPLPRHPSQLYEAILEGPVLFVILWLVRRSNAPPGMVLWVFLALYGLFRPFVELFREPDQQLGFLFGAFTMGQLLSLPLFLIGTTMIVVSYKRASKSGTAAKTRKKGNS
ncbi:MAG: prolipoprotein diacylglyceryl transferase [Deltaproteobacteria bacterium]|nr:prolipoprotein diacylglyceryl transferase [Deltaproteobacteria bacterium]TLN01744.1 MAG: prolipoprotein diacylglyceryl transferase [bacterium]